MSAAVLASASSPGKVLICGGYLVVESPNVGISIGVSARFTTVVTGRVEGDATAWPRQLKVSILSPQFNTTFDYELSQTAAAEPVAIKQLAGPDSPFLYNATLYSIGNIAAKAEGQAMPCGEVNLSLLADNDFYSQRAYLEQQGEGKVSAKTLRTVPQNNPIVGKVSKTGLGSSAALTTSFVACLHRFFGILTSEKDEAKMEEVHRVAQVAHSVSQGKIGSGFDVFTAVYGTNVYSRFSSALVSTMMGSEQPTSVALPLLQECIAPEKEWVNMRRFPGLPPKLKLLLGDIHQGGSATPGMVSKIMAWRKSVKDTPGNLWDQLAASNEKYIDQMFAMNKAHAENEAAYDAVLEVLSKLPAKEWGTATFEDKDQKTIADLWVEMTAQGNTGRTHLRDIGEGAEVEVEPKVLTPLLDTTAALPGVLAVGCPGAGGYDAVFALALGPVARDAVEGFWEAFTDLEVCPLLVEEDSQGIKL